MTKEKENICKLCGHKLQEEVKTTKIPKLKIEIDNETTQLGKSYNELIIPKGKRLLTANECMEIHNDEKLRKKLGFDDIWIWIQQPFEFNKKKGYVAGFGADSGGACLNCDRDPSNSNSDLGVRFCKDLKQLGVEG